MAPVRVVVSCLLVLSAAAARAQAQDDPGDAPAGAEAEAPKTATTDSADDPTETGWEPDQRGVIGPPQPGPEPAPAYGPEPAYDTEGFAAGAPPDDDDSEADEPDFYVELQNGYSLLDPAALSADGARAYHGYTLGFAAGLHHDQLDAGLRFAHGFHEDSLAVNALALDARLALNDDPIELQLRFGLGLLLLSDLGGAGGALAGVLVGPGVGVRGWLSDVLSLGAALDVSLVHARRSGTEATGLDVGMHVDLAAHF